MAVSKRLNRLFVEAMLKHLPPSAATLRLLDVNGETQEILSELREDLQIEVVPGHAQSWQPEQELVDAIVAYAYVLNDPFLERALERLRPGGRLIVLDPNGEVQPDYGQQLEQSGYARILVETAIECPLPTGVLIRGEKPHQTKDTLERIRTVADQDDESATLVTFRGRYVHLLVHETPNKPVWARAEGERVMWKAAAVEIDGMLHLLAFSSLPRAVSFMQPAVLAGAIKDVNKVGKFRKSVAESWPYPAAVNPQNAILDDRDSKFRQIVWVDMDPDTAETPDE